jgi:kynurenine 3-monooxygenase
LSKISSQIRPAISGTIKCFPWNVGGKSLLLGDSAHAVVPFTGKGMNASFEDCRVMNV